MVKSISNKTGHVPPSKIQKPQQPFAKALDKIASDKKTDKPANSNQSSVAAPKADEPNSNTTLKEKVHSVVEHLRIGLPKLNNKADSKSDKKNDDAPKVEPSDNNKADVKSGKSDDDKVKDKSGKSDDDKADVKADKKDDDKPKAPKSRKEIKAEAKAKMKEMLEQMKEAREAAKRKQEEMKAAAKQKQEEMKAAAKQKQEEEMKAAAEIKKVELNGAAQLKQIQKMEQELAEKAKLKGNRNTVKEFLDDQQDPGKQLEQRNSSKLVVLPQELLDELAKPITPGEQKPPTSNKPGLPEIPTPPSKPPANNGAWTQSLFHDINEKYFGGNTPGSGGFGLQFTS